RTPDGAINDEAVRKRPVVVAAVRIDRENLGTFADQQNLPITDMADQLSVLEKAGINTLRQVRSGRLSLLLSHLLILRGCAVFGRASPCGQIAILGHDDFGSNRSKIMNVIN